MPVEDDINIGLLAVNGIFPLPLEHPDPNLIPFLQIQHQALALHDAPVAGLGIQDGHGLLVPHQVHVGLLEIPGVHIEAEVVNPWNVAEELPGEHVEVLVEVDEFHVEGDVLEVVGAVERLPAAHGEGGEELLAGVALGARLALLALPAVQST